MNSPLVLPAFIAVKTGNFLYFLFIGIMVAIVLICRSMCKEKGKEFTNQFILWMAWINFAGHFLKQLTPFYLADFPMALTRSSMENFCAVLVILWPFIYVYGDEYLKDYLYYVGILSGVAVFLFPTGALNRDLSSAENVFEVFRFYSCHAPLILGGFLMVDRGIHKLNFHRIWAIPLLFTLVNFIVFLNGIFLSFVIRYPGWPHTWEVFSDRDYFVNQSATFGPPTRADSVIGWMYNLMIPGLQVYYVDGVRHFTPSLCLTIPVAFVALIFGPLLSLPYDYHRYQIDFETIKQKRKLYRRRKQRG